MVGEAHARAVDAAEAIENAAAKLGQERRLPPCHWVNRIDGNEALSPSEAARQTKLGGWPKKHPLSDCDPPHANRINQGPRGAQFRHCLCRWERHERAIPTKADGWAFAALERQLTARVRSPDRVDRGRERRSGMAQLIASGCNFNSLPSPETRHQPVTDVSRVVCIAVEFLPEHRLLVENAEHQDRHIEEQ